MVNQIFTSTKDKFTQMDHGLKYILALTRTQDVKMIFMKHRMQMVHMKLQSIFKTLTSGKETNNLKVEPIGLDKDSSVTTMEDIMKAIKTKVEPILLFIATLKVSALMRTRLLLFNEYS